MHEIINEKISVITVFDRTKGTVLPAKLRWQGKIFNIKKTGYHYKVLEGRKIIHIFSVCDNNMYFKLKFDTENLHWSLEEVSDGFAD